MEPRTSARFSLRGKRNGPPSAITGSLITDDDAPGNPGLGLGGGVSKQISTHQRIGKLYGRRWWRHGMTNSVISDNVGGNVCSPAGCH
jgi:hypothetical protein